LKETILVLIATRINNLSPIKSCRYKHKRRWSRGMLKQVV